MKIYKTKEDMYKDGIEIRKKAFKEIDALGVEQKKKNNKRKKTLYMLIIIFLVVLITSLLINPIEINSKFAYNKSRYYAVTINDTPVVVDFLDIQRITVIPYMFYINKGNFGIYTNKDAVSVLKINYDKEVEIDIKVYECYLGKQLTNCNATFEKNKNIKEVNDEVFNLKTMSTNDFNNLEYNGKLIKNIDQYVRFEEEYEGQYDRQTIDDLIEYSDQYFVQLSSKHKNISTMITFTIERLKKEE